MPRLAIAPVRDLMNENGAKLVAKDALLKVVEYLESRIKEITKKALELAKHAGREKIMMNDIALALK
jgi:histone H3/H4